VDGYKYSTPQNNEVNLGNERTKLILEHGIFYPCLSGLLKEAKTKI
jgi:hypothetical protein